MMKSYLTTMCWPKIPAAYIKSNEKFSGPLILLVGLITSLWCIGIVAGVIVDSSHYNVSGIIIAVVIMVSLTHLLLISASIASLLYGLKSNKPLFLTLWLGCKAVESLLLLIAPIFDIPELFIAGSIFTVINAYLFICVWKQYKKMKTNPQPLEDIHEKPPSYNQFANETPAI